MPQSGHGIEKNICDNILGAIMNIMGKTKENIKMHLDLVKMGLRSDLHLSKDGGKLNMPPASCTLSLSKKHMFGQFLKELKFLGGSSSNISYYMNIKETKISSLKSHDCHAILKHLLPLALCGILVALVREVLIELSVIFDIWGAKELKMDDLEQTKAEIPITLCNLEKAFPPIFFDVMLYLSIHLVHEAIIGGPV